MQQSKEAATEQSLLPAHAPQPVALNVHANGLHDAGHQAAASGHRTCCSPPRIIIPNHGNMSQPQPNTQGSPDQPRVRSTHADGNAAHGEKDGEVTKEPAFQPQKAKARSGRGKKRKAEGMQAPTDPADGKKDMGDPSPAPLEKASPASQEKSKRQYVKSGKFVGKYGNYQKQRESKLQQQGQADSSKKKRQSAGQAAADVANPVLPCSSFQLAKAPASPFAEESSQEGAPKRRRGRPAGVTKKPKAEAKSAAGDETNADADVKSGSKPEGKGRKPKQLHRTSEFEATPNKEAAVEAEEEAGKEAYGEADEEAAAAARLDMARKASTGDGSRLERPNADSNDGTFDTAAASGLQVQQLNNTDTGAHLQRQLPEEEEEFAGVVRGEGSVEGELLSNGVRVFNPVAPMTKPPHRLSRVTGRDTVGSAGVKEGSPSNGETMAPMHRDDSTFGEYMAGLGSRSSSAAAIRRLNSSGNSGRLLEMLHGSDGLGKLVSELQQEEEVAHQVAVREGEAQEQQHQQQPGSRRKRGQAHHGFDPKASEHKQRIQPKRGLMQEAGGVSGSSTEGSRASRPKRAVQRFDYNVLNGTSGNLGAMLQAEKDWEAELKKASKPKAGKRRQTKLDKDGNRPEVSVYAKAYNKVKAQFTRMRMEETLLGVYGADGWRGAAKERIKLQSELDRARDQVMKCKAIIRECVKCCEDAEGDKAIPSQHYDSDGELPEQFIFCAKCLKGESGEDNDIVLCDGDCNRGYHEQCLQPRIHAADLPEEEGWLCPACDAKADIIIAINEEFGSVYDQEAPWHSLFAEDPTQLGNHAESLRGNSGNGPVSFLDMDLGDADSDDSSFGSDDMSSQEDGEAAAQGSDQEADSPAQSSGSADSHDTSDDSGSDNESSSESEQVEREAEEEGLDAADIDLEAPRAKRCRAAVFGSHDEGCMAQPSDMPGPSASQDVSDLVTGKRRRQHIDYKALNDSMFGNTECYEGEGLEEDDLELCSVLEASLSRARLRKQRLPRAKAWYPLLSPVFRSLTKLSRSGACHVPPRPDVSVKPPDHCIAFQAPSLPFFKAKLEIHSINRPNAGVDLQSNSLVILKFLPPRTQQQKQAAQAERHAVKALGLDKVSQQSALVQCSLVKVCISIEHAATLEIDYGACVEFGQPIMSCTEGQLADARYDWGLLVVLIAVELGKQCVTDLTGNSVLARVQLPLTLQNVARKATADAVAYAAESSVMSEPENRLKSAAQRACETLKSCLDAGKARMGYIPPADTTCIGQQLGGHPEMLQLFQMAMAKD
ncbi:hypothetical protein WJX77_010601 [Trebouxia sp. C0004]